MIPLLQLKCPVETASSDGIKKASEPERITATEVEIIMQAKIAEKFRTLEPKMSASQDQPVPIHKVCIIFLMVCRK